MTHVQKSAKDYSKRVTHDTILTHPKVCRVITTIVLRLLHVLERNSLYVHYFFPSHLPPIGNQMLYLSIVPHVLLALVETARRLSVA